LLVLLGVEQGDDEAKADKLLHKVSGYRNPWPMAPVTSPSTVTLASLTR
jgi:hypothetical protein